MTGKQISKRRRLFRNQPIAPYFKSKRFCLVCKRVTKFEFIRVIGHSECVECGSRASVKLDHTLYLIYTETKEKLEQRIEELIKENKGKDKAYSKLKLKYEQFKKRKC